MIPDPRLSSRPVVADYLSADALAGGRLQDYERGGTAIGDPTAGMNVQTWELFVVGNDVRVRPIGGDYTSLFKDDKITTIRFAWDQNMRPAVAYTTDGLVKLWWYDPTPSFMRQVFTNYPGARDPVICLDDKRTERRDQSDILFFYLRDAVDAAQQMLYMRQQRDRYLIEYEMGYLPRGTTNLVNVGMSKNGRLRFQLYGKFPQAEEGGPRRPIPPYPPGGPTQELILQFGNHFWPGQEGYVEPRFAFTFYVPPVSFDINAI